ncbi:sensor histidine kinase [Paenibacillus thalictri]|uniref:histidine kinase n=1 Tax=Paenibacillus thalictri TaxID=2527873 RepID=A0A4Q9DZH8_9BACL|nr:HAMP domain-containing sensor histidine kinase [Paenibacillus thalictri]TBL81550.1 HAMP domain-containing histidine kinase [Paenibacillus thalictri]
MTKSNRGLFELEINALRSAKQSLEDNRQEGNELQEPFQELIGHYERLLKLSMKIFNISDIQGKSLKRQESEMSRINEQLRQMEKARRQLITDISHELGTPMTSVQGYVKAMLDGIIEPSSHYLQLVYDKSTYVNHLIDDLFEISKLESSQTRLTLMDCSLHQLQDLLQKAESDVSGEGFRLTLTRQPDLSEFEGLRLSYDPTRLGQAVHHLIAYAMKRTPDHGNIHIQVDVKEGALTDQDERDEPGHTVTVSITDGGGGFEETPLPSMQLDRFRRTELGLAIAKIIVLRHEGNIGIIPAPDGIEGSSTVYFTLPAKRLQNGRFKGSGK